MISEKCDYYLSFGAAVHMALTSLQIPGKFPGNFIIPSYGRKLAN